MYAFLNEFVQAGVFSDEQSKEIIVSSLSGDFLKGKPDLSQAHRVRSVMILNRLFSAGGIILQPDGKIRFDFDKVKETTRKMMAEVVRIQIDKSPAKAKEYIDKWFVWSNELQAVATLINKFSKKLNGYLIMPLADMMMQSDFEKMIDEKLK